MHFKRSGQRTPWPPVSEAAYKCHFRVGNRNLSFLTEYCQHCIFLLFFIHNVICKASFESQCTKPYTKEWTIQYFIDCMGNREKRYNHKKECLDYARFYGGGWDDHYVIPWGKLHCQIYFNYRLK